MHDCSLAVSSTGVFFSLQHLGCRPHTEVNFLAASSLGVVDHKNGRLLVACQSRAACGQPHASGRATLSALCARARLTVCVCGGDGVIRATYTRYVLVGKSPRAPTYMARACDSQPL